MKKYFSLYSFKCPFYAQIECSNIIKTSGKSTPSKPILTVPLGQNGCNESWPQTIVVNGTLNYNFVDCSGSNFVYEIQTGQTAPTSFNLSIDFGSGVEYQYDINGNLITLSASKFQDTDNVHVLVNTNTLKIQSDKFIHIKSLNLYSIYGLRVCNTLGNSVLDVSGIGSGMYILEIETENKLISKKVIKH
ncbi:T9SS type A sorting domain-containing protein [Flavobacteriaceae bacterium XHP0103]|uniref:T9SS type A sorting domain-containing protein n=1 Tax=Marixanthotalea marina TaxID=2844359 RepID=UPI002989DEAC|nr:T9SS type A sorting domain-containing protein [Marixanthotalea marina]MBU3821719.1 T9SS type A sorting domain-containing protein [Marixanthotalea marina]